MHKHRPCLRPRARRERPVWPGGAMIPQEQDHHRVVGQGVSTWARALIRKNRKRLRQLGNR